MSGWGGRRAENERSPDSGPIHRCPQGSAYVPFFPINSLSTAGTSNDKWCHLELGRAGSLLQAEVISKGWGVDIQMASWSGY